MTTSLTSHSQFWARRGRCATLTLSLVTLLGAFNPQAVAADWPQWGGAHRDFIAQADKLVDHWPDAGPKRLWTRDLGAGYSGIVADDNHLYTQYRKGENEFVVALNRTDGKTVWQSQYTSKPYDDMTTQFGQGPNATALLVKDRLYTVGITGKIHCFDKNTGKVIWSKDAMAEFHSKGPSFGYSSSPIAYHKSLVVALGGKGLGLVALDLDTGKRLWNSQDFVDTYSSPIIINVDGQDQLVVLANTEIVGIKPEDGKPIWRFPHENQWKTNICTPLWGKDNMLYVSSSGDAGSRLLKLHRVGDTTTVEEIWATRKFKVGRTNAIRVGEYVYGVTGAETPSVLTAVGIDDGQPVWRERGFPNANLIAADGKLIVLDQKGRLTLAIPTPSKLQVRSQFQLFDGKSWTMPILVGSTLYARNTEKIVALDLR